MKKRKDVKNIWMRLCLGGVGMLLCPALSVPAAGEDIITMVTYFPTPRVEYNNIYIGKKLDLGLENGFRITLGSKTLESPGCAMEKYTEKSANKENPLPAIFTKDNPIFLRAFSNTPSDARNKITFDLNSPVEVAEMSFGKMHEPDLSYEIHPDNFELTFYKLAWGRTDTSLTQDTVEFQAVETTIYAKRPQTEELQPIVFPTCTAARWENHSFGQSPAEYRQYKVLVCPN